ncbi:Nucleotide-binding universal stress protein, UspA family [Thalassovita litoralis]|jgi:nucleotide-binding universal stress UspA family protein|uniref:Nucleotide-binding universal stress protein, UspA family n=1 Tax=Thalassovita litoralis TaxID=1010611 RepID=A0A521DTU8_9RHOB|nr:universal stress protein [Thalassovita litoralis]SMO75058.1 Nucleotide-binding universal stress protein, UspA family [Thalassovita litoralis]
MSEKIIALVDGSAYSESVCHHVAWIAGRTGAPVELFHVLGRRDGGSGDLSGNLRLGARTKIMTELAELDAQRAKLAQAQGRAILEDAKAIVAADGVTEVALRLRNGDIVETVTEQEAGAQMIVIGKRGEAADFAKLHLGSNLERIVRAAHVPVFVASRAFQPIKRVLIAYDGGVSAMKAVDYVARNPLFAGLDCTVVTVGAPSDAVKRGLEDAKATLSAGGHTATVKIVEGAADTALGELVEAEGHDLLVMGAYGHSRIRSMIIGSTTTQMIRTCKVPVVLMK